MINEIYVSGKLKGETIVSKKGMQVTAKSLDGHKLDNVYICCSLLSREDCLQLIDFLNFTKECYPIPKENKI